MNPDNALIKQLALTDDFKATQLAAQVEMMLIEAGFVWDDLYTSLPREVTALLSQDDLAALFQAHGAEPITVEHDAAIARRLLVLIAEDPALSPILAVAFKNYDRLDRKLMAKTVLAVGTTVALLMLIASTEIQVEGENWSIKKNAVTSEQIEAIADIIPQLPNQGNEQVRLPGTSR